MLKNSLYGLVVVVVLLNVSCCNAINIPGLRFPLHASCRLTWSWDKTDCLTIHDAILKQIDLWKTDDNCPNGAGEKCLYTLKSQTLTEIKATHTTPKKGYIDDLTFSFVAGTGICNINAYSTSEVWYAVLDYSTNYCNLHNLITGSGLDKLDGYSEKTSDDICTQYSSANCDVY